MGGPTAISNVGISTGGEQLNREGGGGGKRTGLGFVCPPPPHSTLYSTLHALFTRYLLVIYLYLFTFIKCIYSYK